MVARAKEPAIQDRERGPNGQYKSPEIVLKAESVREAAAKLYGLGFKRPQVAAAMAHVLTEDGNVKVARRKLSRWEQDETFRDLIWRAAVVKLDMESPQILEGIAKAAKRGRVDAAKLALGVTERYTDKSDQPQEVVIELKGLGRPNDRELYGRKEEKKALPRGASTTELDPDDLDY